jgi:hypothetical protein
MTKDEQMREIGPAAIEDVRKRLGLNKSAATKAKRAPGGTPKERLGIIKRMIEDFGKVKLNEAYTSMALALCDKIARMRKLSIHRGRIEIWAAAIIHLIARLNFLFDPENDISITADEVCLFFGTKKTTVSNKAGHIQKACGIRYGDLKFSSPEIADLFRLYETEDGFLVPGFTLNGPKNGRRPQNTSQSAQAEDGADEKKQRLGKDRGKRQTRETSKKGLDDRQLKLFDDD